MLTGRLLLATAAVDPAPLVGPTAGTAAGTTAVATAEELVEFFREQLQLFGNPSFHQLRVRRAGALGAALPRRALIDRIIADQAAYFDSASAAIGLLQDRGVVDPSVNAPAFAAWFLGLLLSRIYSDLDPVCDANKDWSEFTLTGILANLLPQDSKP